jgi:hypothetical protein
MGLEADQVQPLKQAGFEIRPAETAEDFPFVMFCSGILRAANKARLEALQQVLPDATEEVMSRALNDAGIMAEYFEHDAARQAMTEATRD